MDAGYIIVRDPWFVVEVPGIVIVTIGECEDFLSTEDMVVTVNTGQYTVRSP